MDNSITLFGVPIISRRGLATNCPNIIKIIPQTIASPMAVCKVSEAFFIISGSAIFTHSNTYSHRDPYQHSNQQIYKRALGDPTAASAMLPENLPTTIISIVLNNNCKFLKTIGIEKNIIFFKVFPFIISTS